MGCGMSRYGLADHVGASGYNPVKKKIEELRGNDLIIPDSTRSTRQFLKEGVNQDDIVVDSSNSHKNISSPRRSTVSSYRIKQADAIVKEPMLDQKERTKMIDSDYAILERKGGKERSENKDKEGKSEEEEEEEEEDEGRLSDYNGSLLIGSPSFREYCVIDSETEDGFKNDGSSDAEKTQSRGEKYNASPLSNEARSTKSTAKGRKRRRLRNALAKGKPSAMKNLLHVSAGYQHHHLPADKQGRAVERAAA